MSAEDRQTRVNILNQVSGQLEEIFDEYVVVGRTNGKGLENTVPEGITFIHCDIDSFTEMRRIMKRDMTNKRNKVLEDEVQEDEGFD